jgi:uncharacterized phiE125 gp8 family phage protein
LNFTDDDPTDDDDLIESLIAVAREECEEKLNQAMLEQSITQVLPGFPALDGFRNPFAAIRLYRPPFISITSISYFDADNAAVTMTPATDIIFGATLGIICPKVGETWPQTAKRPDAVTIVYKSGHANAAAVPKRWKQAILLLVASYYDQREEATRQFPTTVDRLLFGGGARVVEY